METRIQSRGAVDGVNILNALKTNGKTSIARNKPQTWEWRYSVPGHCRNEAPRFSILDDSGRFKLLVEPAPFDTYTLNQTPLRIELYDLNRGDFELVNWADPDLNIEELNEKVLNVRDSLFEKLKSWVRSLDEPNTVADSQEPIIHSVSLSFSRLAQLSLNYCRDVN